MGSFLQQLENNEAVLLMYLYDELPPEDRAEVEQLLASDSVMRASLQDLRQAQNHLTQVLSDVDGLAIPAARESAAAHRVSRAMVKFQLERQTTAATPREETPARRIHLPAWSYPFAAAAMILIAWVAYWGFTTAGIHDVERHPFALEDNGPPFNSDVESSPLAQQEINVIEVNEGFRAPQARAQVVAGDNVARPLEQHR